MSDLTKVLTAGVNRIRAGFVQFVDSCMIQLEAKRRTVGKDEAQEARQPDIAMRFGVGYAAHALSHAHAGL